MLRVKLLVLWLHLFNRVRIPAFLVVSREDTFVQRHADNIVLFDEVVEAAFHEAVGAQR